ncbi:unnamed protein product [Rotaria socialis]|uniref:F-box domain-containing protein n=1 Tax=Rotaria socialis TaxID=392032 RepID=A0A821BZK7_9BILA|nr:unnamed protein product [Rotaria socialis]CAF3641977.1 unnamed protein product [Rotaria socialis]CAF4343043.1 unnamed protein product [Rotaria socialis]CAF4597832.1 unnamed protein product [Rotaria socialis]
MSKLIIELSYSLVASKRDMNKITQFEDLSNDLLLEIFDYFHAFDLFEAFSSMNNRISLILSYTRLHIVLSKLHSQREFDLLSSHLIHHAHQVVSISLQDELRNLSSIISLLFTLHTFENLQSCTFYSIHPLTPLENVMKKFASLNHLVSFRIFQSNNMPLSNVNKSYLSETFLAHRSSKLRSIELSFRYYYPKLISDIRLNSTLTSLRIVFHGSMFACSIDSILPILRHYCALRVLRISISSNNNSYAPATMIPTFLTTYEVNPPISFSITTFDLSIGTCFYFRSLRLILSCMPNLRRFIITIIVLTSTSSFCKNVFNGHLWQQLLSNSAPHLDVFEIFVMIKYANTKPNFDSLVNSFDYFARKFDDWHVAIHQSRRNYNTQKQQLSLHGFRYSKQVRHCHTSTTRIVLGTLTLHESVIKQAEHHLFYSNCKDLCVSIPIDIKIRNNLPPYQLFKNIDRLTIEINSPMRACWIKILNLLRICYNFDRIDQKERAEKITSLVDLTNITKLSIQSNDSTSQSYFITEIFLATSHVIQLKISHSLIFSSMLYHNSSLIPFFTQLQSLYLQSEYGRFPLKYASKLVQRFPSIIHLELEVYSIGLLKSFLSILLDGLPRLAHLKIHFYQSSLIAKGRHSINDILERWCHLRSSIAETHDTFTIRIIGQLMNIYLSGCAICANTKNFI